MQTLSVTKIDNESTFDSVLEIKLVSYTIIDVRHANGLGVSITQFIFDTYNSGGWTCNCSHDCCGHWASFVLSISFIRKGLAAVTVRHITNV